MYIDTSHFPTPEDEYKGLEPLVRAAIQARMDEIAHDLDRTYGAKRTAERLNVTTTVVNRRRNRHKERTMANVIAWGETPTRTPAIRHTHKDGTLHVEVITDGGWLAQLRIEATAFEANERLPQLAAEIHPWLSTLDALRDEDVARAAAARLNKAVRWYDQAEGISDEIDRRQELAANVKTYQTPADVDAAGPDPEPFHIADAIIARLTREADEAHERAVAAAPGEVPELLLWTTPKSMTERPRSLAGMLKTRLATA